MASSSALSTLVTSCTQPPQPVPTFVHFLSAGISTAPSRMALQTLSFVTLLQEQTVATAKAAAKKAAGKSPTRPKRAKPESLRLASASPSLTVNDVAKSGVAGTATITCVQPPAAPTLVSPSNGATNVASNAPVALTITADPASLPAGETSAGQIVLTHTGEPTDTITIPVTLVKGQAFLGVPPASACSDGVDNDADGSVDFPADPGCSTPADPDERPECSDEIDNDGDSLIDHPDDPGCPFPSASIENPQCDDGIDNDQNGSIDFEDWKCQPNWPYWEKPPACGLGAELILVLPSLLWLRRRRVAPS